MYLSRYNTELSMKLSDLSFSIIFKKGQAGFFDGTINTVLSNRQKIFNLLILIVICLIWVTYTFNKTASFQEGWYMMYSDLILSGKRPYIDYEFLYFPLYSYIFTGIVSVFGSHLIVMRVVGAIIFTVTCVMMYLIVSEFLPCRIALIAALVGSFFSIIDEFYVSYDYQQFALLTFMFCLYPLVKALCSGEKASRRMFISGIFCCLTILIRPQSGLILFAIICFVLLSCSLSKIKRLNQELLMFTIGTIAAGLCFLLSLHMIGLLEPFLESAFNYETKGGSLLSILLSFIDNFVNPYYLPVAVFLIICLYVFWKRDAPFNLNTSDTKFTLLFLLLAVVMMVALFFGASSSLVRVLGNQTQMMATFAIIGIITTIVCFAYCRFRKLSTDSWNAYFCLFVCGMAGIAMVWGSTTSGPITAVSEGMIITVVVGFVLFELRKISDFDKKSILTYLSIIVFVLIMTSSMSVKAEMPYHWWGNYEEQYSNCNETTDIEYFDFIRMSPSEKYAYEDFSEQCAMYLGPGDNLYCYANNMLFYHIANKTPVVNCPVPWYDVATNDGVLKDLDYLKNNNPQMIVFQDTGAWSIDYHEYLYGDKHGHKELYQWISWCRENPDSPYEVVSTYYGSFNTYVMVLTE